MKLGSWKAFSVCYYQNYSGYLSHVAQESSPIEQTVTNLLSESSVYSTSFPRVAYDGLLCYTWFIWSVGTPPGAIRLASGLLVPKPLNQSRVYYTWSYSFN